MDNTRINTNIVNDPIFALWKGNADINYKYLNNSNVRSLQWIKNNGFKRGFPVVLVGAGASLDKSVNKLNEIKDSYFIIAADAALPHLRLNGITPDLVVTIDPNDAVIKFYNYMQSSCTIVCPISACPEIFNLPDVKIFTFLQQDKSSSTKEAVLNDIAGKVGSNYPRLNNNYFVGATMLQICDLLSPSQVVLFGYDFAYIGGRVYCEGTLRSKFGDKYTESNKASFDSAYINGKVVGLSGEDVSNVLAYNGIVTTTLLRFYLVVFNTLIAGRTNIVNCSVDWGTQFIPYTDYNTMEFSNEKIKKPDMWSLYARKKR